MQERRRGNKSVQGVGIPDRAEEEGPGLVLAVTLRILSECSGKETSLVGEDGVTPW